MSRIATSKADVVWSYVGTIVSMASGFVLLPLLLMFLSDDELGLWYVYVAVSTLVSLFEFGFNPTFARNIVYVMSGARRLSKTGRDSASVEEGVDWHLLKVLMRTTRVLYAAIALVALLLVSTLGTVYIAHITRDMPGGQQWISWAVFCVGNFLNLLYLCYTTFLRGLGDIAAENKSRTISRLAQLALSAVLLVCGLGLLGAAVGFFANGVLQRLVARYYLHKHTVVMDGLKTKGGRVSREDMKGALSVVTFIAWRDGVVQLALYASTQATSIICSLYLGLAETGTYSVLLQIATAVATLACVFVKSHYPAFQSAYAQGGTNQLHQIMERGITAYWGMFVIGMVGSLLVIFPLLPLFRPGVVLDVPLFLLLSLYLALLNHHSVFCNFIISMNEIPYMPGYLVASILGVVFSVLGTSVLGFGAYGLVLGQMLSQLLYNNWRWPRYVMRALGARYPRLLANGVGWWWHAFRGRIARR